MLSNLVSIAGAAFTALCTFVLVSPNFWVSFGINEPWVIIVKLIAVLATFIFLKKVTGSD